MSCPHYTLVNQSFTFCCNNSKEVKLTVHLICCAEAPASVPQLQAEALGVHTLCEHMFQPRISPRRYLQLHIH
jgi:hypothetical protein